ncbi:MAG: methylated-DNA--[protein]-cysteine S-methyltransferase [Byssovorax sp.]
MSPLLLGHLATPLGALSVIHRDGTLVAAFFDAPPLAFTRRFPGALPPEGPVPEAIARAFEAYFKGDLGALTTLPLDAGGTPFQARVWAELRAIPAGETRSYAALAQALGAPGSSRAVGAANAENPLAIVIPCHRVIRSDGDLAGYAWGLDRKRRLLAHEGALPERQRALFAA